jgi:flagellar assembly factor FliW
MKCLESNVIEQEAPAAEKFIQMSSGLLGFETVKNYSLLGSPEEAPFLWLKMEDEPHLSFLVVEPALIMPDYQPDISEQDVKSLGITGSEDALVLNIVTLHNAGEATVNLKGPILINRRTLAAKQVIPVNATEYSLQHPLAAAAVAA